MRAFILLSLLAGAALGEVRMHAMITAAPALARRQAAASCDAGQTACTDTGCCPIGSPCTTSLGKPICGGKGVFCATTCDDGFCCGIGKKCTTDDGGQSVCAAGFGTLNVPSLGGSANTFDDSGSSSNFAQSAFTSDSFGSGGSGGSVSSIGGGSLGGISGGGDNSFSSNGGSTPTKTVQAGSGGTGDASKMSRDGIWGIVMLQVAAIVGIAAYAL